MNACQEVQPAIVIHLASIPIAKLARDRPIFAATQIVQGTLSLLEAARSTGVHRFVYVSSSMVYGDFDSAVIDETHPQRPAEPYRLLSYQAHRPRRLRKDWAAGQIVGALEIR